MQLPEEVAQNVSTDMSKTNNVSLVISVAKFTKFRHYVSHSQRKVRFPTFPQPILDTCKNGNTWEKAALK